MKKIVLMGLILILGIGSRSLAYRPFGTEDAGVAGKRVIQAELSYDYLKWKDGSLEGSFMLTPIYGITENLEISCEIPYFQHNLQLAAAKTGIGDINLVAKYLFVQDESSSLALAVKSVVKLDNGDFNAGHGSGGKDYSLFAVCSKTLGRATIHSHLGYSIIGRAMNPNLRNISLFGLALDYSLTDPLHLALEINGNRHPDSTQPADPRNCLFGITYKASEKVIYDSALKIGLSDSSPVWDYTLGASITL
ncbi:transporter [Candidatus Saganbacteria bacterium]|nr:transporter [Candidatus Saganbacteria bacterium]